MTGIAKLFEAKYMIQTLRLCSITLFTVILAIRVLGIFVVHPDPWGIIENNVTFTIQSALSGLPIYMNPELPPFSITQYSPLYYHVNVFIDRIMGIGSDNLVEIYQVSRILSLLFNLCFATTVYLIATKAFSIGKQYALFIFVLVFSILQPHSFSRPDSLYNFLFLATILAYLLYLNNATQASKSIILLMTSCALAALSIFSKQSGIILLPILMGFQLFWVRRTRDLLLMSLSLLIFLTACYWLLVQGSSTVFFQNTFKGLDNGISLSWFWHHIIVRYFCTLQGLCILYFTIFLLPAIFRQPELHKRFLAWAFLLSTVFAGGTALKMGSTPSYFTEAFALALAGFAVYFKESQYRVNFHFTLFLLIMMQFSSMVNPRLLIPVNKIEKFQRSEFSKQSEILQRVISKNSIAAGDWVFIDEYAWDSFLTGIFHKNVLFPNKDILEVKIVFNYSQFDALLESGRIKYIISKKQPDPFIQRGFSRYILQDSLNGYRIYTWR